MLGSAKRGGIFFIRRQTTYCSDEVSRANAVRCGETKLKRDDAALDSARHIGLPTASLHDGLPAAIYPAIWLIFLFRRVPCQAE